MALLRCLALLYGSVRLSRYYLVNKRFVYDKDYYKKFSSFLKLSLQKSLLLALHFFVINCQFLLFLIILKIKDFYNCPSRPLLWPPQVLPMPRRGCPPERPWREGAQRASKAGLSLALVPRCRGAHTRAQTQTSSTGSATRPRRGALTHPVTKTFPNTRTHIYPGIRAGIRPHSPRSQLHWRPSSTTDLPERSHRLGTAPPRPAPRAPLCLPGAG